MQARLSGCSHPSSLANFFTGVLISLYCDSLGVSVIWHLIRFSLDVFTLQLSSIYLVVSTLWVSSSCVQWSFLHFAYSFTTSFHFEFFSPSHSPPLYEPSFTSSSPSCSARASGVKAILTAILTTYNVLTSNRGIVLTRGPLRRNFSLFQKLPGDARWQRLPLSALWHPLGSDAICRWSTDGRFGFEDNRLGNAK